MNCPGQKLRTHEFNVFNLAVANPIPVDDDPLRIRLVMLLVFSQSFHDASLHLVQKFFVVLMQCAAGRIPGHCRVDGRDNRAHSQIFLRGIVVRVVTGNMKKATIKLGIQV